MRSMASITVSTHVAAPVERVFEVFTELDKAAERIPDIVGLEILSEGPFGLGTRWRETRVMFKKEATEEMWVTAFDPPKSYSVEAESHGMRYSTLFSFAPDGDGTAVSWDFARHAPDPRHEDHGPDLRRPDERHDEEVHAPRPRRAARRLRGRLKLAMTELDWLEGYAGQTTEELLALEGRYRTDSIVLALEQALERKAASAGRPH